jgi:hypothetical protein
LFDDVGVEPTLDDLIAGAWEALGAHSAVRCPICGGSMSPEYAVHALPIGGRCERCDSTLR